MERKKQINTCMCAHTERNIKETSSHKSWAVSPLGKRGTKERETERLNRETNNTHHTELGR